MIPKRRFPRLTKPGSNLSNHEIQNSPTTDALSIVKAIRLVFSLLPDSKMRRGFFLLAGSGILVSLIDIVAVGLMAALAAVLSNADAVKEGPLGKALDTVAPIAKTLQGADLIMAVAVAAAFAIALRNLARATLDYRAQLYYALADGAVGKQLMTRIIDRPYTWHIGENSSDLILAVSWRSYFGSIVLASFMNLVVESVFVTAVLVVLIAVSPLVSSMVIAIIGLSAVLAYRWNRTALDRQAGLHRLYKITIGRLVAKTIHGIRDVKIFGKGNELTGEFETNALLQAHNKAKQNLFIRLPNQILETVGVSTLALAIGVLLYVTPVPPSSLITTIALLAAAAWRTLPAVTKLLSAFVLLRNALPYIERVSHYVQTADYGSAPTRTNGSQGIEPGFQTISFDSVGFRYPTGERPALSDFNLRIERNEAIGIVGPSGSGKSTFVDLLVGLLVPAEGTIKLGEETLTQVNVAAWRKRVGYVPQSPYIADGSLAENIAFGCRTNEIDLDRVRECCEMAAIDFLDTLHNGLNTPIGERGILLSGGQRQRVAIARALYNDPEILIFDEATSALDEKLEDDIRKTIYEFKGQLTLVIVAHRLRTVEDCDRIIWLEKGKVRSSGSPSLILADMHSAYDEYNRMQ